MKKIELHGICQCKSCKIIRKKNNKKQLIYMDPPYHGVKSKLYTGKVWDEVDFVKLRNHFHELSCAGYKVMLSMSDTLFIRELFKGYNIKEIKLTHDLTHKKGMELMITNYDDLQLKKVIKRISNDKNT